ncbi:MAG TPA: pyridoxamine 5'-phosphate oxidase family protein [Flavisolibacter sp.]|nr:pyridoxamine 5'-phosphate oxidase family protein [Flavisolibacter sp.]
METTETKLQNKEAIEKFRELAEDVNICMFTTIDADQNISSRPMFTSDVDDDGNVWFFTNEFSEKINEVSVDNIVHLIYAHPGKNIYLDVKGTCSLIIDRKKMEALWDRELNKWFPGGLEDPKVCLIKVATESAHFWNHDSSKMGLLFHMIKSITRGEQYKETERGQLNLEVTPQEK